MSSSKMVFIASSILVTFPNKLILKTNVMNNVKRAQVIMLPSKEMLGAYSSTITKVYEDEGKLYLNPKKLGDLITELGFPQYLYFISDDKIKEGDWYYDLYSKGVFQCRNLKYTEEYKRIHKKIIATTDNSLFKLKECPVRGTGSNVKFILPQPSQQFIEKYIESYNKGEVINDVLVEYEEINIGPDLTKSLMYYPDNFELKLKINSKDNTITIKKLKNSWNKEEVRKLCLCAYYHGGKTNNDKLSFNDFIKENL